MTSIFIFHDWKLNIYLKEYRTGFLKDKDMIEFSKYQIYWKIMLARETGTVVISKIDAFM